MAMRTWARVKRDTPCGACGTRQATGTPVLEIRLRNVHRALIRCTTCTGLEPPPDLPPLVEATAPIAGDFAHVSTAAPKTHGALKQTAREWLPYREGE